VGAGPKIPFGSSSGIDSDGQQASRLGAGSVDLTTGEIGEVQATDAEPTTVNPLLRVLQSLEVELHHDRLRCDRARLDQLLHPEFHKVGRAGRANASSA